MTKDEKESSVSWKYSGKEDEWDSFDRRMVRHMRSKLDKFGERMWMGEIKELQGCDATTLKLHVAEVYNALQVTKPKEAKEMLKKGSDFF